MTGYQRLAAFMTDKHYPILKKYQQLAARDLLYLQAELCDLNYKYKIVAEQDALRTDERQYYDRDWSHLESSLVRGFGGDQWSIVLATRAKLREYYSALSQYSQIASMPQPKPLERKLLQEWIKSPAMGGGCGFIGRDLGGFDQPSVYEEAHQKDLAILSDTRGEDDLFTKFVTGPLLTLYHSVQRHRREPLPIDPENPPVGENRSSLHHYDDHTVEVVTNVLGTMFSSFALLLSIIVLSFVKKSNARLGLVCVFTILFSACLAIASKSRRVEIFAASAAFAGVQVVFIGTSPAG